MKRLCKIAAPDTLVERTSNLGVLRGGEDLGVASLAFVCPALGHLAANAVETGGLGKLAKPAADEDLGEVVVALVVLAILAGGENLTECASVQLVDHDTIAGDDGVHGV